MKTLRIRFGVLVVLIVVCGCRGPAREESARHVATCERYLKQMGLNFKMFANESTGEYYPRLSPQAGRLMFDNKGIGRLPMFPEYFSDLRLLICPADPDVELLNDPVKGMDLSVMIDDHSYFYLGYAVRSDADVKAFAEAYKERIKKGLAFDEDLATPTGTLHLLHEAVGRFFITDIADPHAMSKIQATIPLLIERPENHTPEGGNVLFMDGHVEFLRYDESGRWPMTRSTIETLQTLDKLPRDQESGM
jgi:prepilin-type processing-associated H-X9-DG protein